ncbi:MAG: hypothetical protein ACFFCQ_00940 [Promethearchaeota archaeon]
MSEKEKKGYQEIVAAEIGEMNDGQRLRITGIFLDQKESVLIIGDRTGEIEVIVDAPIEFKDQEVVRIFGTAHNGRVIAEYVVSVDLNFDLFVKMLKFEKEMKRSI